MWQVVVNNVGIVYSGRDERLARKIYADYSLKSERGEGRAAGEDIYLMKDGEDVESFPG